MLAVPCSPSVAGVDGLWSFEWVGTGAVSDVQPGTWRVLPASVNRFYCGLEELKDRIGITDNVDDSSAQMASLSDIRNALGARIAAGTGLRVLPAARDQISPPVAIILPGQPVVSYGNTMDGTFTINLRVLITISDAAPDEKVQRALDAYLGIGASSSSGSSIAGAIQADPTLGGVVHYAEAISAATTAGSRITTSRISGLE